MEREPAGVRAMILDSPGRPLRAAELPDPVPGPGQVLLKVRACAVCRTDLHVQDGELPAPSGPRILGHEIAGEVIAAGPGVSLAPGTRLGVPWLGYTDGTCDYCRSGRENLCPHARFTGYDIDGGFADRTVADARYCFPLPVTHDDLHAAPLLCAGLIGHRALSMTGGGRRLGLYGFGAAAHLVLQEARAEGRTVFAFARPGDAAAMEHARSLGAAWAGASNEAPPEPLDAAILFAPVGALVPEALRRTAPGGVVVAAGIHMSDIPSFSYDLLWGERVVRSVANLTRADAAAFLPLAGAIPVRTDVEPYPLAHAQQAMDDLRAGKVRGAAVLTMD